MTMTTNPLSPHRNHKNLNALIASLLAFTLILASCGHQDDQSSPDQSATGVSSGQPDGTELPSLELLDTMILPPEWKPEDDSSQPGKTPPFGGISALDRSADGSYIALSDDRSEYGDARAYRIKLPINTVSGRFTSSTPIVTQTITLKDHDGNPFPKGTIDPEGLRILPSGGFILSSEGDTTRRFQAMVSEFTDDGVQKRDVNLPSSWTMNAEGTHGVRNNLGPEGLALWKDQVVVANESSLAQDGAPASATRGSLNRFVVFGGNGSKLKGEYVYQTDTFTEGKRGTMTAALGVSEIIALNATDYLVLERGFDPVAGNRVRLYWTTTSGATTINGVDKIDHTVKPLRKTKVFDFRGQDALLDNIEAMSFGPQLTDRSKTLILASDDNFDNAMQRTIFYLLRLK